MTSRCPRSTLRVVTKDNSIGTVKTESRPYKVQSLLANEPNAQPKVETKPVAVLEDNWLPMYIARGLARGRVRRGPDAAGLALPAARARARGSPATAATALGRSRSKRWRRSVARSRTMLDAGQGAVFVDQLSDVVRAYLGGRYAFDGLETTTDEMLTHAQSPRRFARVHAGSRRSSSVAAIW